MLPELKNNSIESQNLPKISDSDLMKLELGMSHITCIGKDFQWQDFYGTMEFDHKQRHTIRDKGRKLQPIDYSTFLEFDEIKGLEYYEKNKNQFLDLGNAKVGIVTDKGTKKELVVINLPLLMKVVEKSKGQKVNK